MSTTINPFLEFLEALKSGDPAAIEQTEIGRMAADPAVQQEMARTLSEGLRQMQTEIDAMAKATETECVPTSVTIQ